jgi:murein DD-endopeptidase MepM/ murein hydrolase activator NlpD
MKIVFKTRFPLRLQRILLLLVLLAGSTIYYLRGHYQAEKQTPSREHVNLLNVAPIVPELPKIASPPAPVTNTVEIQRNETFSELMESQGFDPQVIQEILESSRDVYNLGQIHAGNNIVITSLPDNDFSKLQYDIDPFRTLVVTRTASGISATLIQHETNTEVVALGGFIDGSLYNTIDQLGEGDELVVKFADIFEWDVDFFKDLQEGDSFRILTEKKLVEGQPYGYGNILAAELTTKGKVYTAVGFQRGNNWEYFSPDGKAMRKAFLASPLKFSRITSGFTKRRYHPILHGYRPHYGIDYAAPIGTPVRSIGSGRVIMAGWAGGAGRAIKIQHNKEISTVYCHLSRFGSGIRAGASVSQGQIIGYVGSTGLSTGPHLDFRYLKNGQYVNFLSVKAPQDEPLTSRELQQLRRQAPDLVSKLAGISLRRPASGLAYTPPVSLQLSDSVH